MNERIKELAKRANIQFSRTGILDGDPNGIARFVGYSKMEKFADLIVQECIGICNKGDIEKPVGLMYANQIKKHFGVE